MTDQQEPIRPQLQADIAETQSPESLDQQAYKAGIKKGVQATMNVVLHNLGNSLALTRGYSELLAKRSQLNETEQGRAELALDAVNKASELLLRLGLLAEDDADLTIIKDSSGMDSFTLPDLREEKPDQPRTI